MHSSSQHALFIGLDLGTSGCRGFAIDIDNNIVATANTPLPLSTEKHGHIVQDPMDWWLACQQVLRQLLSEINPSQVEAICVDGTSGTVLLCDKSNGAPISDGFMYNDSACTAQAEQIKRVAPDESGAHGVSSGLSKCLFLLDGLLDNHLEGLLKNPLSNPSDETIQHTKNITCLNQADWIAGKLLNRFDTSDENNTLKMGYDPIKREWPPWLNQLNHHNIQNILPQRILQPGDISGLICTNIAKNLNLPTTTKIIAGTTDSIAAFIATGCENIGEAVTSLGSTLAIKLISNQPVFSPKYGIYSHRLGHKWLVGGASNTGGAVIKAHFTSEQIQHFSNTFNYKTPTGLNYYPLMSYGERFPISDANKTPVLTPRPTNDIDFFHGILEGIAAIEKMAFDKLTELGAPYPTHIVTMGGGSQNEGWRFIREKMCKIPISNKSAQAKTLEAAYGSALLAKQHTVIKS